MITPSAFSITAIQLEPLLNTVLFLSQEGIRTVFLHIKKSGPNVTNVSFVPFLLGCPIVIKLDA